MPSIISAGTTANTGLNLTADTSGNLVFQTNGNTTAMTIDTSQNVTYANGVSFTGVIAGNGANISSMNASNLTSGTVASARLPSITSISNGTSNVAIASSNGSVTVATNGTTAVTIDTSQRVGIGTASPDRPLVVTSSSDAMTISQTGGGVGLQMSQSSVNDVLLRMTNSSGHYWDIRNQGSGSQLLIGGFFGDTLRLGTTGNLQFNSGYGSVATAYGCRAWVNFNGTGTPAIRASGNVSSITDNGTGAYAVNFTTAMPDANYSGNVSVASVPGTSDANFITTDTNNTARVNPTTSSFAFTCYRFQGSAIDTEFVRVAIFR